MSPDAQEKSVAGASPFPRPSGWSEVTDARVRAAFARVDRRRFVPEDLRDLAHRDEPLPIGEGQTVSQPYVVALMLQALMLEPGDRVLEIGAGSGYQTALLCELVRTDAEPLGAGVHAIERHPSLLERAAQVLRSAGYTPRLAGGDGALGWPEAAPFHAIVVSAAAVAVPRPLVEQLADGGRLVIPVGAPERDQELWLVQRLASRLEWHALGAVRFVPLISPILAEAANRVLPPPIPRRSFPAPPDRNPFDG
jgi:protein-L-isoaspartate(D-aspartate) O-methyltransferase